MAILVKSPFTAKPVINEGISHCLVIFFLADVRTTASKDARLFADTPVKPSSLQIPGSVSVEAVDMLMVYER